MTYFKQKFTSVLYISSWWTLKSWVLVVCHPQHWNKLINVWLSYTSHHWSLDIAQWFLIFEIFCLLLRYLQAAAVSLSDIVLWKELCTCLVNQRTPQNEYSYPLGKSWNLSITTGAASDKTQKTCYDCNLFHRHTFYFLQLLMELSRNALN